jgi:hypothetical protein
MFTSTLMIPMLIFMSHPPTACNDAGARTGKFLRYPRGLNGANSNASGGNKQRSAPQRQLANAQMAQPTTSQPNNNAQIVNIAGSASDPRVVVVSSTTSVNLRVSNPGTEPSGAAKFVLDNVGSGVSAINSGRDDGAALSPGGLFVSRFIDSLRDTAERYEAAEGTAPREKTENDSVRLDENAARNLPSSGVPASADLVESAQWTESKKEALKEFVKKKLEALAEGTTPEVLAKETEDSNFVAALKNAKRDPSVFDKLADDITDSVQSLAVNDRQISAFLSKKAAERDRERMLKNFVTSGQQPVRAVATEQSFFDKWELDFSNGKGLIAFAIIGILGMLIWTSRTK